MYIRSVSMKVNKMINTRKHTKHYCYYVVFIFLLVTFMISFYYVIINTNDLSDTRNHSNNTIIIAVLGGGLLSNGQVPQHTQLRLDKAYELYHKYINYQDVYIIPLSAGTPYKPNPIDNKVF